MMKNAKQKFFRKLGMLGTFKLSISDFRLFRKSRENHIMNVEPADSLAPLSTDLMILKCQFLHSWKLDTQDYTDLDGYTYFPARETNERDLGIVDRPLPVS